MVVSSVGHYLWPLDYDWIDVATFRSLGLGLMAAGLVVLVLAYGMMARARTTIDPRQHTTRIVTSGIYRVSRNPIYLGWFAVFLGRGLQSLSGFAIAMSLLMIAMLHRGRWC